MAKIPCKFCGAENENGDERCSSCSAPLSEISKLSETDEKSIGNYIRSIEKTLKSTKGQADAVLFLLFLLIVVVWGLISFLAYINFPNERSMIVVLIIIFGLAMFAVFGGLAKQLETKAMRKTFNKSVKENIYEYLEETHFTKTDIQYVAGKELSEKSGLLQFISEL